ncbi:GlsB/YeaQ/YmgE family stress response membrane protein [Streptomyces virginiae]|uniref:GlsB/YeaQ/YmgE family stress response membrane protein n=1 Tax=Streptomyces virginiae TaxID=1961 RepID=UPI0036BECD09
MPDRAVPGSGSTRNHRRPCATASSLSLLGGFLGKVIFGVDSIDGFFDLSTWIAAIIGSVILLAVYRLVTGNKRHHNHA